MNGPLRYRVHEDVSYCRVEDGLIFLDVARNRYFRLPRPLEATFWSYIKGDECTKADVHRLVERKILTTATDMQHDASYTIESPLRSNVEKATRAGKVSIESVVEVLATVLLIRSQLRRRPLKAVLASMAAYRKRKLGGVPSPSNPSHQDLIDATDTFRRVRPYVPVPPVCLLDSLAMTRFLARRKLQANIIFGVTASPFSAHCWVQAGGLILNDTVGHTHAYTRIRIV